MSAYPAEHPSSEPSSFVQSGPDFWWTYNPDAELGEGHGIGYFFGDWMVWRDRPEGTGDRFVRKLPVDKIPNWALSRKNHLL